MSTSKNNIRIFSGDVITVNRARAELDDQGIKYRIQNDFESGLMAGFSGGTPTAIDLYVMEEDAEAALKILEGLDTN